MVVSQRHLSHLFQSASPQTDRYHTVPRQHMCALNRLLQPRHVDVDVSCAAAVEVVGATVSYHASLPCSSHIAHRETNLEPL